MSLTIDKVVSLASAIIQNKEGKLLLLQRSGVASYPDHWQLVEGKLEESENILEALKREIYEETGTSVSDININTVFHKDLDAKGLRYLAFRIVFKVKIDSEDIELSDEHKAFGWFTKDEALKLSLLPGIEEIIKNCF